MSWEQWLIVGWPVIGLACWLFVILKSREITVADLFIALPLCTAGGPFTLILLAVANGGWVIWRW